jgi:hypothetical protein
VELSVFEKTGNSFGQVARTFGLLTNPVGVQLGWEIVASTTVKPRLGTCLALGKPRRWLFQQARTNGPPVQFPLFNTILFFEGSPVIFGVAK